MRYLIFLDIDGTLLSRGGVPQRTASAIQRAIEQGNLVFINTGRSKGNIPFSHLSDVPLTGIVAGLGAYIEVEGQVIFSHAMSNEEIAFAMQIASEIRTGLVLEGEQILLDHLPEYMNPHWRQNRPAVASVEDMERRFSACRISKISFTNPISAESVKKLEERLGVISHSTYAEVFSKGLSKATAMDFLKRRFDIADDHIIAMGDSHNDVEMLRAAGIAVVMGDGNPDVKPLADFISIPSHEGGVGQALEVLVLQS